MYTSVLARGKEARVFNAYCLKVWPVPPPPLSQGDAFSNQGGGAYQIFFLVLCITLFARADLCTFSRGGGNDIFKPGGADFLSVSGP